jgi:hypothetical protein
MVAPNAMLKRHTGIFDAATLLQQRSGIGSMQLSGSGSR